MQKTRLPKSPALPLTASFRETELACLALVGTEIEVALSFLRLADAETGGGNDERAKELIAKAIAIHNVVLQYIQNMRGEFETEKRDLWIDARRLLENIRAVERRRSQSDSQVLAS